MSKKTTGVGYKISKSKRIALFYTSMGMTCGEMHFAANVDPEAMEIVAKAIAKAMDQANAQLSPKPVYRDCRACGGEGYLPSKPTPATCPYCNGEGRLRVHCAKCGEIYPCSASKRTDIHPAARALHVAAR